jgi:hypothetical protein
MRYRTGLLIGLAVGYYYGSKAGRERYEEIDAWLDKVRSTTTYQDAQTKLADGWREGTVAARNLVANSPLGGAVGLTDTHDRPDQIVDVVEPSPFKPSSPTSN